MTVQNPAGFRLIKNRQWQSNWTADSANYAVLQLADTLIKDYVAKKFKDKQILCDTIFVTRLSDCIIISTDVAYRQLKEQTKEQTSNINIDIDTDIDDSDDTTATTNNLADDNQITNKLEEAEKQTTLSNEIGDKVIESFCEASVTSILSQIPVKYVNTGQQLTLFSAVEKVMDQQEQLRADILQKTGLKIHDMESALTKLCKGPTHLYMQNAFDLAAVKETTNFLVGTRQIEGVQDTMLLANLPLKTLLIYCVQNHAAQFLASVLALELQFKPKHSAILEKTHQQLSTVFAELSSIQRSYCLGFIIKAKGRINGADRKRIMRLRCGATNSSSIDTNVSYGFARVQTPKGLIAIHCSFYY